METIGLSEVTQYASRALPKGSVTTAHVAGFRHYRKQYAKPAPASMLDRIARSCSPFALDTLHDEMRLMRPDARTAKRWQRAVRARLAELRGVVLA